MLNGKKLWSNKKEVVNKIVNFKTPVKLRSDRSRRYIDDVSDHYKINIPEINRNSFSSNMPALFQFVTVYSGINFSINTKILV